MIAIMDALDFYNSSPYLPSGTEYSNPLANPDGRCAMCHNWTKEDADYLVANGALLCDVLPNDWFPEDQHAAG